MQVNNNMLKTCIMKTDTNICGVSLMSGNWWCKETDDRVETMEASTTFITRTLIHYYSNVNDSALLCTILTVSCTWLCNDKMNLVNITWNFLSFHAPSLRQVSKKMVELPHLKLCEEIKIKKKKVHIHPQNQISHVSLLSNCRLMNTSYLHSTAC
jgi:hypothetical protein